MKKDQNKLSRGEIEKADERTREILRKEFDFYEGVDMSIVSYKNKSDTKGTIRQFFSSRLPKLHTKSRNSENTLEVEISSAEEDNQSLLHYLFRRSSDKV